MVWQCRLDADKRPCLQVVLEDDQTVEAGQKIADELMVKLGIGQNQLLTGAYMDLILSKTKQ